MIITQQSKLCLSTETAHRKLCITIVRATTIIQQEDTLSYSVLSRKLYRSNGHLQSLQSTPNENGGFPTSTLAIFFTPSRGIFRPQDINHQRTAYMAISSSTDRGNIAIVILRTNFSLRHHNRPTIPTTGYHQA